MFGKNRITIKISGMDCEHCASAVKQALSGLDGVKKAEVNLGKGEAYVTVSQYNIPQESFERAIEDAGYKAESFANFKFL